MVIGVVIVAIDKPWYPEGFKNILPERTSRAQPQLPIYRENKRGMPPVPLGELAVLSVHSHSSLAKIITSRYTIYVGDLLLLK